jgi:hypothetical protein
MDTYIGHMTHLKKWSFLTDPLIFRHRSLSAIPRKKIGEPKGEIRNLNGFEYMYLSDLKVLYF